MSEKEDTKKKVEKEYVDIMYNQDLPTIKYERKRLCVGHEMETEYIYVSGKTLVEAKSVFDKVRKETRD